MPKVSDDRLAARRREILDGARHCFAEYGYDGATVKRIEESTGLSRGAIFHHFRDKEALFLALASEDAERMADVAAEQGLVQVMRDVLARPQDFDWLGTRLEIARKLRTDKSFRDAWMSHSADVEKATLARLERGRASGRLRDDVPAEVLVKYLDLVLDGLITRLATGQPTDDLHDVLDLVEESVRVSRGATSGPAGNAM
ncbi:helix-turn-helix domain-containing protein [Gordonia sp. L191]|uniref:TetR/AcrR family transcriptional regulator n=1 Tax=Gordonia TaxID=2053 RepID=UPI001AD61F9D|nr:MULTISPECIES: TetR/AcrR family transcriptional regulator [Gordonia]QTI67104.1 TetR/AcrR family transcriptional regulator [Gordonia polyisoprenivorans]WHU49535.1 helix-turn-helix domain-containing protein [Gordonia sp. L191]